MKMKYKDWSLSQNEDVWLNTEALPILFNVKSPVITKHIYNDGKPCENSICSKMEHMGNDEKQIYYKYLTS